MKEMGLYSEPDAGFVETQLYTQESVAEAIQRYVDMDGDPEDVRMEFICPEHEEQIEDYCEECFAEEEEEDE